MKGYHITGQIGRPLLELFFPTNCPICGRVGDWQGGGVLCPECICKIEMIKGPLCQRCGLPFLSEKGGEHTCGRCLKERRFFDRARAAGIYQGELMEAVRIFKYQRNRRIEGVLIDLMLQCMDASLPGPYDIIVPVPLHKRRVRERGFNQAALLARGLGKNKGIKVGYRILRRTRYTPPQVNLKIKDRERNVRGAFSLSVPWHRKYVKESHVKERRVLLVDDVLTTGSTINECSKVLKRQGGAALVDVLTVARAT